MDLKFITYNCRGLPRDRNSLQLRPDIMSVFVDAHIIAFQETWLSKQNLSCINSLHESFVGSGVSKVDETAGLVQGRFSGYNVYSLHCEDHKTVETVKTVNTVDTVYIVK